MQRDLDTYVSPRDQAALNLLDQQSKEHSEREAVELAKSNLSECLELAEMLADNAADKCEFDHTKNAARAGCLTAFIAVWATRIPEIRQDLERQTK